MHQLDIQFKEKKKELKGPTSFFDRHIEAPDRSINISREKIVWNHLDGAD